MQGPKDLRRVSQKVKIYKRAHCFTLEKFRAAHLGPKISSAAPVLQSLQGSSSATGSYANIQDAKYMFDTNIINHFRNLFKIMTLPAL